MAVSKEFILAGNAIFTIEIPVTAVLNNDQQKETLHHVTFKVERVEANENYAESYFVKMLTGPDNTKNYTYIGRLDVKRGQVNTTAKSKIPETSRRFRLLNRILALTWRGDYSYEDHGFTTHHEGKCGKCGRKLTVPESIETGIGPKCAESLGIKSVGTFV